MSDETILTVHYKNKAPVELTDLGQSFTGLAHEYKSFLELNRGGVPAEDLRLYIKEIRHGSIIVDAIAFAYFALPFMEHTVTVLDFSTYLKEAYDYLLGKIRKPKFPLDKPNYENLAKVLEPAAKERGSQIILHSQFNAQTINITINSLEANAAQNTARREIENLRQPITGTHEKVLLYWYQARNDKLSNRGDRAIIESIQRTPVKTVFVSEGIKGKMLLCADNPFKKAFIVDVAVDTIAGKPALYRILDTRPSIKGQLS